MPYKWVEKVEMKEKTQVKSHSNMSALPAIPLRSEFYQSERNLWNFRQFYLCFPIVNAVRSQSAARHISRPSKGICIHSDLRSELRWMLVVRELQEAYG